MLHLIKSYAIHYKAKAGNIQKIISESQRSNSTIVVCNHVPTAQQVYRELKKEVNDTVLLHSQFTRRDRNKIENDLGNKLPKILVATQVVEVSLDLDFQQAFTEPAPIDALAQRMGRVNRRARQQQPAKVHIFTEQAHKFNIYDPELTAGSLRALI